MAVMMVRSGGRGLI